MAEPKQKIPRKVSKTRRGAKKLKTKILTKCKQCGEEVPAHQVCPECGYYKGKEIIKNKK